MFEGQSDLGSLLRTLRMFDDGFKAHTKSLQDVEEVMPVATVEPAAAVRRKSSLMPGMFDAEALNKLQTKKMKVSIWIDVQLFINVVK